MVRSRRQMILSVATGVLAVWAVLTVMGSAGAAPGAAGTRSIGAAAAGPSYVFRLDPDLGTYEVFTVARAGADLWGVDVISGASRVDVWFAEAGADRIGRLAYTDTLHYALQEYALAAGSEPLNVAVDDGGDVWFTEAGRNRIGRLNPATAAIAEFEPLTAGSRPADLALAPDGSVWFTQMLADQVAHLVVASESNYTVTEYAHTSLAGGRPYGIALSGGSVYLAQTANDRVTRFTPPGSWLDTRAMAAVLVEPYALAVDSSGGVWGTERAGNRVDRFEFGTYPSANLYVLSPPGSMPSGIAIAADDSVWISQWAGGQVAHLVLSVPPQRTYYPLPIPNLAPRGIAIDGTGAVWVVASPVDLVYPVYLPQMFRDGGE